MFNTKGSNLSTENEFDLHASSNEKLQARNAQDMESAISNVDGVAVKNNRNYANVPGGFLRAPIHQNWVIIRQNEQIIDQNAAIISLLQNNTSD